ncbi:MAG: TlpA family protein disulfide reductase [Salinivirgaceae bacterium]|nr:TlpA family protein disulfide reductase [Salinivirgaceae bacterium]
MKILFPIAAVAILCACTHSTSKNEQKAPVFPPHNRTIESPVYGAKSGAMANVSIEKIEITDSLTRLFMIWNNPDKNGFKISPESYIVANGQKLKILSDSIDINTQKGEKEMRFILNFQDVDSTVQTIDFLEGEDFRDFKVWNIALNDYAAARIKADAEVPDSIVRKARTVSNDAEGLDSQCLMCGFAYVKGKIYGYHPQVFSGWDNYVYCLTSGALQAPTEQFEPINNDGTFLLKIPVTKKHQYVNLRIANAECGNIHVVCNDTVSMALDLKAAIDGFPADRENAFKKASYFGGADAEINNYDFWVIGDFNMFGLDKRVYKSKMQGMTLSQYTDFIMAMYREKQNEVNSVGMRQSEVNSRAINRKIREMYDIMLRQNAIQALAYYYHYIGSKDANGNLRKADDNYYNALRELAINNNNDLYNHGSTAHLLNIARNLANVRTYSSPYEPEYEVVSKEGEPLVVEFRPTTSEKKAQEIAEEKFGITNPIFRETQYAHNLFKRDSWADEYEHVNDTIMALLRTMSDTAFAQFAENINRGLYNQIDTTSYWHHSENESLIDSVFVELIKDFEGKVIYLNFWSETCAPCHRLTDELKQIEKELPTDKIVFINICDEQHTREETFKKQSEKWGNTNYRLSTDTFYMVYTKFNFSRGYPHGVIINKKGQIVKKYSSFRIDGTPIIKSVLLEEAMK